MEFSLRYLDVLNLESVVENLTERNKVVQLQEEVRFSISVWILNKGAFNFQELYFSSRNDLRADMNNSRILQFAFSIAGVL